MVYEKNEAVLMEQDSVKSVGVILSGSAQMIQEDIWGSRTILSVLHQGDVFGESFVYSGTEQSRISVNDTSKTSVYLKNLIELESSNVDGAFEFAIKPGLHEFSSFAFEDVCREYVRELQIANRLPFRYQRMGRWWGKTTVRRKDCIETQETEIDLLAVNKTADQYLVGEWNFKGRPFSYAEYLDTSAKLSKQKENAEVFYYLFSESGFDDQLITEAESKSTVHLVGLQEIVKGVC